MQAATVTTGRDELRKALWAQRWLFAVVAVFSMFANLLMLSGPIYMLQVYDRVLLSGSTETLVALTLLVVFLYAVMAAISISRASVLARVGRRFHTAMAPRVTNAMMRSAVMTPDARSAAAPQDLDAVQLALGSPLSSAMFDLPWTVIFFGAIFLFHPLLGALAVGGAALIVILAALAQWLSLGHERVLYPAELDVQNSLSQLRGAADVVQALGMCRTLTVRIQNRADRMHRRQLALQDLVNMTRSLTFALRMLLQSLLLGLGAWLTLQGQISAGAMLAATIMSARASAPIDALIGYWPALTRARQGWSSLTELLAQMPPEPQHLTLPRPEARLDVNGITVAPPMARFVTLRGVTFSATAGQGIGVIGPSGSGKTTLARALVGLWPAVTGDIRLGRAALPQYGAEALGRLIGYLPQQVPLFDGTIAQNIARFDPDPEGEAIIRAAQQAAAHDMILSLPDGYDTEVKQGQAGLSGGQLQRIGLARAVYGDPVMLVLDEPNANLDSAGSQALNRAVQTAKARGAIVLILTHRPAAIQECDMLLVLEQGRVTAFGPKARVLQDMVRNASEINLAHLAGGAA